MKRTVSIPVNLPDERFLPLMNQCAEIFNAHIDWALANRTYNKNKAHKELYQQLRLQYPCVPSALLQTVRNQRRNKKVNKWISSWGFYQLEQFLVYKTEAKGKKVGYVARYTSQKCSRCKQRHSINRHKSKFHCKTCGFKTHADINAATNIKDDYILSTTQIESVEQGSVNDPYVSIKCSG